MFESFGMTQFVNSPTRGDNLLDVIASVDPSAIKGVSVNDGGRLSDHQLIVAKLASHRSKQNVRYQCRNLKAVERELRSSSLFSCPESSVDGFTEQHQRVVITVLDVLAPVQCRLRRPPNPASKWLSTEAVAAKRERRRLERRWLSSRNESDRQRYRRACRSANKVINDSRKNYFRRKCRTVVTIPGGAGTSSRNFFIPHQVTTAGRMPRIVSFVILSLTFFLQNAQS